jgi:hypothetical protein
VGLQAQEPEPPYLSLWTRLRTFGRSDLTALLESREVVRGTTLRGTQHLHLAEDHGWQRALVAPALATRTPVKLRRLGVDPGEVAAVARSVMAGRTVTRPEIRRALCERWPEVPPELLNWSFQYLVPMVHPPPSGVWGHRGAVPCALAEDWLGGAEVPDPDPRELVRRYLAGYGPADAADVGAFSGVRGLRTVVAELGELRRVRDEDGRELVDVADGRWADPDEPAPVRFLPRFDNLLLGHADRRRVVSDEDRPRVITGGLVRATVLVDGFAAATWTVEGPALAVSPFRPWSRTEGEEVEAEGMRLLEFLEAGEASARSVRVVPSGA